MVTQISDSKIFVFAAFSVALTELRSAHNSPQWVSNFWQTDKIAFDRIYDNFHASKDKNAATRW